MKQSTRINEKQSIRGIFLTALLAVVQLIAATGCSTILDALPCPAVDREPFSIIMLPDTQNYADLRPKAEGQKDDRKDLSPIFYKQTEWIRDNKERLNIKMVTHVGDIVQADYDAEWKIADRAFKTLDDAGVPYGLCVGNHDMGYLPGKGTANTRETLLNKYFPPSRFARKPWYGGHFEAGNDNSYCLFEGGGIRFLLLSLEFTPRDETLEWASGVIEKHPERRVIVSTHWHLDAKGNRFLKNTYISPGNTAQEVWDKLIKKHETIFMVLCGHVLGEALLTTKNNAGEPVHQILADYQGRANGGDGFLRIMTFVPDENSIQVRTYSPHQDKYIDAPISHYNLKYNMGGPEKDDFYLFSYFTKNGEDGLRLLYSEDGLKWKILNNGESFLRPEIGGKLMRDPCIIKGPDGYYHMVWTTGWWEKGIGHAQSKDLVNWSEQQYIAVMEHEPTAKNTWAPEVFYDESKKEYVIFWATTIPGRFPETEKKTNDNNHRMYCVTTKDFKTFSKTRLFYEPGFNVIDSTIVRDGSRHVMFLKNETLDPVEKNIRVALAKNAAGPYGDASKSITGDYWAEGPTAMKIANTWYVYFDKYRDHVYGAVASEDLENWRDVSELIEFPKGTRHGTIFRVPRSVVEPLLTLKH